MREFTSTAVRETFSGFPDPHRERLLALRELIFEVGDTLAQADGVLETLKWREPSYAPRRPRVGSPVRVGVFDESDVALYFNCRTLLVENIRSRFGDELDYSKNRAVRFAAGEPLPSDAVRECVRMALLYHRDKG